MAIVLYTIQLVQIECDYKHNAQDKVKAHLKLVPWGFPGGAVVENPPANAGHMGSIPGPGRSHMPQSN